MALSSKERPSQLVDFPRYDAKGEPVGKLRIRVLTQEEQMACSAQAERIAREHLKEAKKDDLGYERLFMDAMYVEVLLRACRDEADTNKSAFPSAKEIRKQLTTDECGVLFDHYLTTQLELGPLRCEMSDEELEAWITRLAEGGSAFPLALLSTDLQKVLIVYMACQLRTQPTANASAGTPLAEPSIESFAESELPETD